ncbi:MAG TPA: peptidase C39 family protein [Verrucomicrobiae bacterium]
MGIADSSGFTRARSEEGSVVLLSPSINAGIHWDQLIVSWNADAPAGTFVTIEAAAIGDGYRTRFYTLGKWSSDGRIFPRTSVVRQKDADGRVDTDTLVLQHAADAAQIRITLGGTNGAMPTLKFLGCSFANTLAMPSGTASAVGHPWEQSAGMHRIIPTPERSQHGYPQANGWCSPASVSMVLGHWADVLHRPELDHTVPDVASAVYDPGYPGTGNWSFNTAFAGGFRGLRAYVTRLDDLGEVEAWVAAGIPVVLSTRWDWLRPGRPLDAEGHLIVVIGFTENGDVIANDPSAQLNRRESVRQIYRRADVVHAWAKSHHAVYLIYPLGAKIPENDGGHWQK